MEEEEQKSYNDLSSSELDALISQFINNDPITASFLNLYNKRMAREMARDYGILNGTRTSPHNMQKYLEWYLNSDLNQLIRDNHQTTLEG